MYKAEVIVPGSCGELVQGLLNNTNIMITCPINLYSRVSAVLNKNITDVSTNIRAEKTIKAVRKLLNHLNKKELGADININSQLLRGKGMASSTADITGAMAAVMCALGYCPDLKLIKKIALEVEPTDGVFLPGINYFDHIEGKISRRLGKPPALDILIFTEQGEMDTLSFNKIKGLRDKKKAKEEMVSEAVNNIIKGLKQQNKELIGKGATLSTIAHQQILYKPYLNKVIEIMANIPSLYGVNNAHSGKLIGLIVDKDKDYTELITNIERQLPISFYRRVSIIAGGIRYLRGEKEYGSCSWREYRANTAEI